MHYCWTRHWKVIANTCANTSLCPFTILLYSIRKGQRGTIKTMAKTFITHFTRQCAYPKMVTPL